MRRRLATLLTAALLGAGVLLPLTAAPAAGAVGAETVAVLAAQGPTTDAGLEPRGADAEDNEFAPPGYEENWTWRVGGVFLLVVFLLVAAAMSSFYYFRVHRPRQRSQQS